MFGFFRRKKAISEPQTPLVSDVAKLSAIYPSPPKTPSSATPTKDKAKAADEDRRRSSSSDSDDGMGILNPANILSPFCPYSPIYHSSDSGPSSSYSDSSSSSSYDSGSSSFDSGSSSSCGMD